ncbi:hypothetical protein GZ77_17005 [Endozoicomonas montiporae]|uniref:Uncharacterized protein n=2 Tax=Endozoicomonas montiporae TaxID=1027273 RepID=A0A081N1E7_9GAMM|nr:hypothetical protein GZ77_17005 [Endozoicomonas montiporae]
MKAMSLNYTNNNERQPVQRDRTIEALFQTKTIGRRVCAATASNLYETLEMLRNGRSEAIKSRSVASQVDQVKNYLSSSLKTVATTFDPVNPVSVAIRKAPWYISTPLKLACDEVQAGMDYLSDPVKSAAELMEYMIKKPSRIAKLMQAAGVPVPADIMTLIKLESDVDKAHEVWSAWSKKGIDPVKFNDKNTARFRGKIILSLVKALFDHDPDKLGKSIERYLTGILESSGERVLAKSLKVAMNYPGASSGVSS